MITFETEEEFDDAVMRVLKQRLELFCSAKRDSSKFSVKITLNDTNYGVNEVVAVDGFTLEDIRNAQ